MAANQLRDGAAEGLQVERPPQTHRVEDGVCGAARDELVQEPEPLLGERQGQRGEFVFMRHVWCLRSGAIRRAGRAGWPRSDRRRGLRAAARAAPTIGHVAVARGVEGFSQRGDTGALEDRAQGQLVRQPLPHPRHHLGRQQRVPSQLEEVVVYSYRAVSQQLPPDLQQRPFGRCLRRPRGPPALQPPRLRRRQGTPVQLAVRRTAEAAPGPRRTRAACSPAAAGAGTRAARTRRAERRRRPGTRPGGTPRGRPCGR